MTAIIPPTVEQVAIDQLRPDPANPRRIGEKNPIPRRERIKE